jgi:hypothetical protein
MVDKSESRVREEARQRDHRQLYDLLAGFLTVFEEGRRSGPSMVSEPLALLAPQLLNQVSRTQCFSKCDPTVCQDSQDVVTSEAQGGANQVVISQRPRSADCELSMPLSKNSTHTSYKS